MLSGADNNQAFLFATESRNEVLCMLFGASVAKFKSDSYRMIHYQNYYL
jgi:hypothetical protein